MLRQRLPHSIRNARISLELCEEVENRRLRSGHSRLLGSGGMDSQGSGAGDSDGSPNPNGTDLNFNDLAFTGGIPGISWLPNNNTGSSGMGPNDGYGSLPSMEILQSPGFVFY